MSDGKIKYMLNAFDVIIICSYAELVKAAAVQVQVQDMGGRKKKEPLLHINTSEQSKLELE